MRQRGRQYLLLPWRFQANHVAVAALFWTWASYRPKDALRQEPSYPARMMCWLPPLQCWEVKTHWGSRIAANHPGPFRSLRSCHTFSRSFCPHRNHLFRWGINGRSRQAASQIPTSCVSSVVPSSQNWERKPRQKKHSAQDKIGFFFGLLPQNPSCKRRKTHTYRVYKMENNMIFY